MSVLVVAEQLRGQLRDVTRELVTAAQEQLKVTVLVLENHGYQSIHALQRARVGASFGLEFRY